MLIIKKIICLCLFSTSFLFLQAQTDSLLQSIKEEPNPFQRAIDLFNLVAGHAQFKSKGLTLELIKEGSSYFSNETIPSKKFIDKILGATLAKKQNNISLSLKLSLESISLLETYQHTHLQQIMLGDIYNYTGYLYYSNTDYEPATTYYIKALEIGKKETFLLGQAIALSNLSLIYEKLDNYEKCIELTKESLAIAKNIGDKQGILIQLGHLAIFLWRSGMQEHKKDAIQLYYKAINLAKQLREEKILSRLYLYLAAALLDKKEIVKTEQQLLEGLSIYEKYNDTRSLGEFHYLMGLCKVEKAQFRAAVVQFEKALTFFQEIQDFTNLAKVNKKMADLLVQQNQAIKANKYLLASMSFTDSVTAQLQKNNNAALEESFRLKEVEIENQFLEKEQVLQKTIISSQRTRLIVLSLLGLLAIISSIIFFIQKKKIRESYQHLVQKNRDLITNTKTIEKRKISSQRILIDETLKEKILFALEEEQLYLNPDLTLSIFAKHLNSNSNYVSKTINAGFKKNFNTFINEYRIKQILSYLEEGQYKEFTIEFLGQKGGFNSRVAFTNAFKKYTGVTPSFYIQELDN